ncbi:MAG: sigma-E processing peptidase SpoIIGA [Eubacterium sp.]|nr:sigma-E processing peptidase SpoIIGA [Eubacterium sp.]
MFIINFFITFLLLQISSKIAKRGAKTLRLVAGATLGGAYSLIILIDDIPIYIFLSSKILCAVLLILITFGFMRIKSFISVLMIFLFSNFVFLGVITGIQMLFKSNRICTNNGEIYIDINAKELILSALFAYLAACIIIRLYNKKLGAGEIYSIIIENNSKEVSLFALSDTGNKLREPFSDYPVIIVKKDSCKELFDENSARLIPSSTINSSSYLTAYKPQCVKVKTSRGYEKIENVYVALSEEMNAESFSAIINPEIISV